MSLDVPMLRRIADEKRVAWIEKSHALLAAKANMPESEAAKVAVRVANEAARLLPEYAAEEEANAAYDAADRALYVALGGDGAK